MHSFLQVVVKFLEKKKVCVRLCARTHTFSFTILKLLGPRCFHPSLLPKKDKASTSAARGSKIWGLLCRDLPKLLN